MFRVCRGAPKKFAGPGHVIRPPIYVNIMAVQLSHQYAAIDAVAPAVSKLGFTDLLRTGQEPWLRRLGMDRHCTQNESGKKESCVVHRGCVYKIKRPLC